MQQLEEEPDVSLDNLAFVQLKVIILERIAALEEQDASDPHPTDLN